MDEYNSGMDPEVKRYFRRIINSFSYALFWLIAVSTAGLYFGLALPHNGMRWYHWLFYFLAFATLLLLLRYFLRSWKKKE